MVFPLIKLMVVAYKQMSRPINNLIVRLIKSRGVDSIFRKYLITFGQTAHYYELRLNNYINNEEAKVEKEWQDEHESDQEPKQEIKVFIKPLSSTKAFNKGVEWFSEIFFFYGILLGIAGWELSRSSKAALKEKQRLEKYKSDILAAQENLRMIKES